MLDRMFDSSPVLAASGFAALGIAGLAWLGDWRRRHRKNLDAVGFVDWTSVFFLALLSGLLLLILAYAT